MIKLTLLNQLPKQTIAVNLENGTQFNLSTEFKEMQSSWFYSIFYPSANFQLNGVKLTTSPNLLRQFKNIIPFGLACITQDGLEPFKIDDFTSGRASLYAMNKAEVRNIEDIVYGKENNYNR